MGRRGLAPLPPGAIPEDEEYGSAAPPPVPTSRRAAPLPPGPVPDDDHGPHNPDAKYHFHFPSRLSARIGSARVSARNIFRNRSSTGGSHSHLHLPHLFHHDHENSEFAFERPDGMEEEDDDSSLGTDSTSMYSSSDAENGKAKKVKGGVRGAGVGLAKAVQKRHIIQRVCMAVLAVCFLWLTSYAVCKEIVLYFITVPEMSEVIGLNTLAYEEAEFQRAKYVDCVEDRAETCRVSYESELQIEVTRSQSVQIENSVNITNLNASLAVLEDVYNQTIQLLNSITVVKIGGAPSQCDYVDGLIAGQAAAVQALGTAQAFQDTADKQVLSLETQLFLRQQYDKEYMENKTTWFRDRGDEMQALLRDPTVMFATLNNTYNNFEQCIVVNGTCPGGDSAFTQITSIYDDSLSNFNELKNKAAQFRADMQIRLDNYALLISKLKNSAILLALNEALPTNINVPPDSDSQQPNYLDNLASTTFAGVMPPNSVVGNIQTRLDGVQTKLGLENGNADSNYNSASQSCTDYYLGWNSTYDPPPINGTSSDYLAANGTFMTVFNNKLTQLASPASGSNSYDEQAGNSTVSLNSTVQGIFTSVSNHSDWDFYSYGDDIAKQVNTGLTEMNDTLMAFDIAFRLLRTVLIIRKYWNLSRLATPPGDARVKTAAGQGWGPHLTPTQKIVRILTNPLLLAALSIATVMILLYLIWYLYGPLYLQYVDGCVKSEFTDIDAGKSEGSMLYRNGYEVMFQYSASEGDSIAIKRVDELNVGRDLNCNQRTFDGTVIFNNQVDQFNSMMSRFTDLVERNKIFQTCLDLNAMGNPTLSALINDTPEYNEIHYAPSVTAIYNCSAVGSCQAIRTNNYTEDAASLCQGPNTVPLKSVGHRAACTTENYIHASLFFGFMLVSTFILLNFSRLMIMRGIVRIMWRHISPSTFSFLGSCTDSGHLRYPENVVEGKVSMQEAIRLALKKRLNQWERWGYLILITGILLNAPWVYGLQFLSDNLEYSSD